MITHDGKKMPVSWNAWVRVRFHNGKTDVGIANVFGWVWGMEFFNDDYDIIEYEVIEEVKSEREILVTPNATHGYFIWTESEFLHTLKSDYYKGPERFLFDYKAFVIKDGKFRELTEDDIEMSPKLKI